MWKTWTANAPDGVHRFIASQAIRVSRRSIVTSVMALFCTT
jgi:hypothetical protein